MVCDCQTKDYCAGKCGKFLEADAFIQYSLIIIEKGITILIIIIRHLKQYL